jgi:hypothetical protein
VFMFLNGCIKFVHLFSGVLNRKRQFKQCAVPFEPLAHNLHNYLLWCHIGGAEKTPILLVKWVCC